MSFQGVLHMSRDFFKAVLVSSAMLVFASGCATTLRVKVMEPAQVNLGAPKRLSIVQSEGRRSARESVIGALLKQARTDGYFQVADRTEEGITVKITGRTAAATGGKTPQVPDEYYARIDVQGWEATKDEVEHKSTDAKGRETVSTEKVWKGEVVLGVTLFNVAGKAVLAEKEFKGVSSITADQGDKDAAIEVAGHNAVSNFLNAITPRMVEKSIRLDDDDKGQKAIIEVAKGGNLPRAVEELRAYLAKDPNNTVAMYNLAVLLDATGQYKEALDYYTKAASNSTKDYYSATKGECAKRLAAQEALAQ
jgi:tetratricopeptide (TPR) repeat protein